jgi:hypothetical protein
MALVSVTNVVHGEVFFDVFVTSTGTGSQLVIGGYDDGLSTGVVPEGQMRVFKAEVSGDISGPNPYKTVGVGHPAFQALRQSRLNSSEVTPANVYTQLTPNTPLAFSFLPITIGASSRNLFFWNGTGVVDFSPVGSDVTLSLIKGGTEPWTESINGGSNSVITGNTIATTSSVGQVHTHLITEIGDNGGVPAQGFYLFSLQLQMTGYAPSESLYFVYGALDYADIQNEQTLLEFRAANTLAGGWVHDNLVVVPEPSAAALLGLATAAHPLLCWFRSLRARRISAWAGRARAA